MKLLFKNQDIEIEVSSEQDISFNVLTEFKALCKELIKLNAESKPMRIITTPTKETKHSDKGGIDYPIH